MSDLLLKECDLLRAAFLHTPLLAVVTKGILYGNHNVTKHSVSQSLSYWRLETQERYFFLCIYLQLLMTNVMLRGLQIIK